MEVDVAEVPMRDRIRWGPIIAGVVTAFAVLLFLSVLGIALGISALGGDDPQTWGTAAGIWGGLSLLVAFFVGGWMAARAAATLSESDGPLNGFVTGAATLLLLLWLATTALTGALGILRLDRDQYRRRRGPGGHGGHRPRCCPPGGGDRGRQAAEDPAAAVPAEVEQAAQQARKRHPRLLVLAPGVRLLPSFSPLARRRWAEWLDGTNGWCCQGRERSSLRGSRLATHGNGGR